MGFTKGTWDVFKPLFEDLHRNSKFRLVEQGQFIIVAELCGDETYVHRITPDTGDVHTLNSRCGWGYEDNLWLQAPIKIIKAWSFTEKISGKQTVYDNEQDALQELKFIGDMIFGGFSTDHPLPNTGKFYLNKHELIEDILNEEYMDKDLITDTTETADGNNS